MHRSPAQHDESSALRALDALPAAWSEHLFDRLGLRTASDVRWAARVGALADAPEASPLAVRRLERVLRAFPSTAPTRPLAEAREAAARTLDKLQREPAALRLAVVGEVRRMVPDVTRVDLLATAHDPEALRTGFTNLSVVDEALPREGPWSRVRLRDGSLIRLDVLEEDPDAFFARLIEHTGPPEHVRALHAHARACDLAWPPPPVDGAAAQVEAEIYARLDLPFAPPELRSEDLAPPPDGLLTIHDVRGAARFHTDAGRGTFTLDTMASRLGTDRLAWGIVADAMPRSPASRPTSSWDVQRDAIDVWHARARQEDADSEPDATPRPPPARIFQGAELALSSDGGVHGRDALAAGVAAGFVRLQGRPAQRALTESLAPPGVKVLTQPDRRFTGGWGTELQDWMPVFAALAKTGGAVELSGQSHRIALPPGWHAAARDMGLPLLLSADAHRPDELDNLLVAVGQARRGCWTRDAVINTWDAERVRTWLEARP